MEKCLRKLKDKQTSQQREKLNCLMITATEETLLVLVLTNTTHKYYIYIAGNEIQYTNDFQLFSGTKFENRKRRIILKLDYA